MAVQKVSPCSMSHHAKEADVRSHLPDSKKVRKLLGLFFFTSFVFFLDHYISETAFGNIDIGVCLRSFAARSCTFDGGLCVVLSLLIAYRLCMRGVRSKAEDGHFRLAESQQKQAKGQRQCPGHDEGNADGGACFAGSQGRTLSTQGEQSCQAPGRSLARWNQAIDQAAKDGDPEKAAALLRLLESSGKYSPDVVSYNLVIRAFAKSGDAKSAQATLSSMAAKGVEATVCSYNTVMDACSKANDVETCENLLTQMQQRGLKPNAISYATAIHANARRGNTGAAETWLKRMEEAGIAPDEVSYNSLIHAYGLHGDTLAAEKWFNQMRCSNVVPTVTTFTAVIDSCAKAGDVARAERWMERLLEAKVEPNIVTFGVMIEACAKAGDAVRAECWLDRMVAAGLRPNGHTYSSMITSCSKRGDVDGAERWLARAEQAGVAKDAVVYSGVVDACAKAGLAERAFAVFRRMQARGIRPHVVVYSSLAQTFARRGDWATVEGIASEMKQANVKPNEYFLQAQLLSYACAQPKEGARAEQAFRHALSQSIQANDHVVVALARSVGRNHCARLMDELCNGRAIPLQGEPRHGGTALQRTDSSLKVGGVKAAMAHKNAGIHRRAT